MCWGEGECEAGKLRRCNEMRVREDLTTPITEGLEAEGS